MKNYFKIALAIIITVSACKKDHIDRPLRGEQQLTIAQTRLWLEANEKSIVKKYKLQWEKAARLSQSSGDRIVMPLSGQPTIGGHPQGFRELSITKSPKTGLLQANFVEFIPDALYFQRKGGWAKADFTGWALIYDRHYQFLSGILLSSGRKVGEMLPASNSQRQQFISKINNSTAAQQPVAPTGTGNIQHLFAPVEECTWTQSSYIDSEGVLVIHNQRSCTQVSPYDDPWTDYTGIEVQPREYQTGGGGGSPTAPEPPAPSNLPGEDSEKVNPKKMMDCFAQLNSRNAAYQVKIMVVEPFPGTSFNLGPNSFGHVAMSLSKTAGGQTITQTIGYYPTGTGLSQLHSKGIVRDNGDISYNVGASYFTDEKGFQKILDYVSNPPLTYDFMEFNCSSFVYEASRSAGLPVPDPMTQVGFAGPGGAGYARTPAGMGSALRTVKAQNPKADITTNPGYRAPASKGECP